MVLSPEGCVALQSARGDEQKPSSGLTQGQRSSPCKAAHPSSAVSCKFVLSAIVNDEVVNIDSIFPFLCSKCKPSEQFW